MSVNINSSSSLYIKPEIKANAMPILNHLHISLGDYVNMALTALAVEQSIPFEIKTPPVGFASWQDFEKDVEEAQNAVANGGKTIKNSIELRKALEEI